MDDGDRQLNFEMLTGDRKRKPRIDRKLHRVDILERASDLNIQKVADTEESA